VINPASATAERRGIGLLALVSIGILIASMLVALRPSAALAGDPVCLNPVDVEFILDNSGSMGSASGGGTRLSEAIEAAQGFVNALQANGGVGAGGLHRVGLTSFNGTSTGGDLEFSIDDNLSAAAANDEIDNLTASGNTPLRDGMLTGQADLTPFTRTFVDGVPVTHAYVLLSDGRPWVDQLGVTRPTAGEIASYVGSAEQAYSILLGVSDNANPPTPNTLDPVLMGSLASNASNFFQITDASQLTDIFGDIATDLLCGDIDLVKTVAPGSLPVNGGMVDYSFRLSHVGAQGSAPFTDVTLEDELNAVGSGIPGCSPVRGADDPGDGDALLEAGETWTFACNDVSISTDTTNWACATAEYVNSNGATTTDCDDATVVVADPTPTPTPKPPTPTPTPTPTPEPPTPTPTPEPPTPTPTPEQPTPTPTPVVTPTPEGSVGGGTGTPAASVPDTAASLPGFGGPLATLVFGLILVASLGTLAYANVRAARERR
jgi:hypothetical protein